MRITLTVMSLLLASAFAQATELTSGLYHTQDSYTCVLKVVFDKSSRTGQIMNTHHPLTRQHCSQSDKWYNFFCTTLDGCFYEGRDNKKVPLYVIDKVKFSFSKGGQLFSFLDAQEQKPLYFHKSTGPFGSAQSVDVPAHLTDKEISDLVKNDYFLDERSYAERVALTYCANVWGHERCVLKDSYPRLYRESQYRDKIRVRLRTWEAFVDSK